MTILALAPGLCLIYGQSDSCLQMFNWVGHSVVSFSSSYAPEHIQFQKTLHHTMYIPNWLIQLHTTTQWNHFHSKISRLLCQLLTMANINFYHWTFATLIFTRPIVSPGAVWPHCVQLVAIGMALLPGFVNLWTGPSRHCCLHCESREPMVFLPLRLRQQCNNEGSDEHNYISLWCL